MKGLRKLALGCTLGFILSGCALGNTLQRGHDQVADGHYRAALATYQRAQQIDPDSDEARRLSSQLTPYAVKEATAEAHAEIARGRYERARVLAAYIAPLDATAAAKLDSDNAAVMRAAGEGLLRKGDHRAAYKISARLRDTYPRHAALPDLLERCRQHYFSRAEQHAAKGEFSAALGAVDTVAHFEPAMRSEVQQRRDQLKGRWAKRVASDAAAHEQAQRRGAAAALFARAYEIAKRPEHLAALRRNTTPLRAQGRFVLAVHTREDGHANALVDHINDKARDVEGLSLPTPGDDGASLIATVSDATTQCGNDTQLEQGEQPYVSGYRQEVNPEYQRLGSDVAQLAHTADAQEQELAAGRQRAHQLQAATNTCDNDVLAPAQQRVAQAQATLEHAQAKAKALREKVANLEQKLASLPRRSPRRVRMTRRLEQVRQRLAAAKQEAHAARARAKRAGRERDQAAQRCDAEHTAAKSQRRAVTRLAERRARTTERLGIVQAQLLATPSHQRVEVIDIFRFPIQHITRSCEVRATLEITPAWTSGSQRNLRAADQTRDRTHEGYPRYGVAADPLHFSSSDGQLVGDASEQAAAAAVAAIAERTTDYYAHMTQNAFDSADQDPHGATDLMLSMLLAAPGQLSDHHKQELSQHLAKNYDLERWQTLTE